jgi:uncharacterized protein YukE
MSQPNLQIDSATLTSLIQEVDNTELVLTGARTSVAGAVASAGSAWTSSKASGQFQAAMQAWSEESQTCLNIVSELRQALTQTLANFVSAEQDAAGIAGR